MPKQLTTVTSLSKTLALVLFIFFPLLGFYLGVRYQQVIMLSYKLDTQQPSRIEKDKNRIKDEPNQNTFQGRGYKISYPSGFKMIESHEVDKLSYENKNQILMTIRKATTTAKNIEEHAYTLMNTQITTINGNPAIEFINDIPGGPLINEYILVNNGTAYTIMLSSGADTDKIIQQQILNTFTFANELYCAKNSDCTTYATDTCCGVGAVNKESAIYKPKFYQVCTRMCPNEKISAVCKEHACTFQFTPDQNTDLRSNICSKTAKSLFRSVKQHEVGLGPDGPSMGYWGITFTDGAFEWSHSDFSEDGTYTCNGNAIVATLPNQTITASYDESNGKLNWDGIEYTKVK